jgi:RPA family protein
VVRIEKDTLWTVEGIGNEIFMWRILVSDATTSFVVLTNTADFQPRRVVPVITRIT